MHKTMLAVYSHYKFHFWNKILEKRLFRPKKDLEKRPTLNF